MRFTRPGPCAATCTAGTLTCPRHARRDPLVNVTPSRLRAGELVAGSGALILAVSLLLPWYDVAAPGAHESGLRAVGWPAAIVLVLAVLVGLGLVVTTLTEVTPARPLAFGVVAVPLGLLAILVVIFRLVAEPGLGVGASDGEVAVEWPAFAGLVGSSRSSSAPGSRSPTSGPARRCRARRPSGRSPSAAPPGPCRRRGIRPRLSDG